MTTATGRPSKNSSLLVVIAALALISLTATGTWLTYRYSVWREFKSEMERIETVVETWRAPPADADPARWEAAWQTAYNAVGNVCFTPEHITREELTCLREDVERQDQLPLSFDTLAWLWSRLAQTGPHGQEYITRMQPLWDEVEE